MTEKNEQPMIDWKSLMNTVTKDRGLKKFMTKDRGITTMMMNAATWKKNPATGNTLSNLTLDVDLRDNFNVKVAVKKALENSANGGALNPNPPGNGGSGPNSMIGSGKKKAKINTQKNKKRKYLKKTLPRKKTKRTYSRKKI